MLSRNSTDSGFNFSNSGVQIEESIVTPILQTIVGVTGNIAALTLLIKSSKEHKWRSFYRLVGGLILSDLLGVLLLSPFILSRYISDFTFVFPTALCGLISFTISFCVLASALTVCAMSFDRLLALYFPVRYNKLSRSSCWINLVLVGIWILSAIICSLHLFGFGSFTSFYPGSWCFINFTSKSTTDRAYTYFYALVGLLILIATTILNAFVIYSVCKRTYDKSSRNTKRKGKDVFIIIYLIAVVIIFSVCWIPLMVGMLVNTGSDDEENDQGQLDLWAGRIAVSNPILDPWMYLILRRKSFVLILKHIRPLRRRFAIRESESEGETDATTDVRLQVKPETDATTDVWLSVQSETDATTDIQLSVKSVTDAKNCVTLS